tara:strand:- start:379 stop:987 length:609 start_codon:yes stop_codon:yes gene_type:complete
MPTEEVKGMMDIIAKLNETTVTPSSVSEDKQTQSSINKLAGVSKNAQGMLSILQKLDEATTQVTKEIVKESENDIELSAIDKKGDTVRVNNYEITMEKTTIVPGIKKTFYNIKEGDEIIHKDLALFETAMGIVKGLLFDNYSKVDRLLELDNRYASSLQEAATYKMKCKTIVESSKHDIAMAKQGAAVYKMKEIKKQIKSAL